MKPGTPALPATRVQGRISLKLPDVIAGLEAAWAFFGGIPKYLVIYNWPPVVATVDRLDHVSTWIFLKYAQHRGSIADSARARHPKDKPNWDGTSPAPGNPASRGGDFTELPDFRNQARRWRRQVAGQRNHGAFSRNSMVVFRAKELQAPLPWDEES